MGTYPGPPYRGGERKGGAKPGLSKGSTLAEGSPPALAFVAPSPPLLPGTGTVAVGAGASGGTSVALLKGAFGGLRKPPMSPGTLLGGAALGAGLGLIAWWVSRWNYTPNLMWMPGGFSKFCENPVFPRPFPDSPGPYWTWTQSNSLDLNPCNTTVFQIAPNQSNMGIGFVQVNTRTIYIFKTRAYRDLNNQLLWEKWTRSVTGAVALPSAPRVAISPAPLEVPLVAVPEALPILKPVVPTIPKPASFPEPGQMPGFPIRKGWPLVVAPPVTSPIVEIPARVRPGPDAPPAPVVNPPQVFPSPGTGPEWVVPWPGSGPSPRPRPGAKPGPGPGDGGPPWSPPGARMEPAPGDKEKKLHVRNVIKPGVLLAFNFATEGLDLVRELAKAIPKSCLRKHGFPVNRRLSPTERFQAVYMCWDDINVAEAITNVINNEFEDFVYGSLGRRVAGVQKQIGAPTGLSRALQGARELGSEDTDETFSLVPQLTYDESDGSWTLSWLHGERDLGVLRKEWK